MSGQSWFETVLVTAKIAGGGWFAPRRWDSSPQGGHADRRHPPELAAGGYWLFGCGRSVAGSGGHPAVSIPGVCGLQRPDESNRCQVRHDERVFVAENAA
jgi:hypothetical protein